MKKPDNVAYINEMTRDIEERQNDYPTDEKETEKDNTRHDDYRDKKRTELNQ